MALLEYQEDLTLSKLYEVKKWSSLDQNKINFWVNSGSINIYHSNSATKPTALSQMTLDSNDTDVSGLIEINILPRYIAIVQNSGTSTEIVSTGLIIEDLGSIS